MTDGKPVYPAGTDPGDANGHSGFDPEGMPTVEPEVVALIPEDLMRRHRVFPLQRDGSRLVLAMADRRNAEAIDDVRVVSGCVVIEPVRWPEEMIVKMINRHFVADLLGRLVAGCRAAEAGVSEDRGAHRPVDTAAGDGPVARLVHTVISQAVQRGATDIHLEPQADGLRVRFRVDGVLGAVMSIPGGVGPALISRVKIMADMDIAEKRLPQDGRVAVRVDGRDIDLRVSTIHTVFGEKAVLRLLDRSRVLPGLDELGFSPGALTHFRELIADPYGMLLVTGPTGSGKTTTLYAVLQELNVPAVNIVTIEDPVEYLLPGVNQIPINRRAGLDFARGLRSILRQDPEIIMVGEIRDRETAAIATRAAITGHLVFSTLHTNDAAGALTRLIDMGIEPFLVASAVLGVLSQRLVRRVCLHCRAPYVPERGSREAVFLGGGDRARRVYRAVGCERCEGSGYEGRVAVAEFLAVTDHLRELVCRRVPLADLRRAARAEGMVPVGEDGLRKVYAGITTVNEVMRITHRGDERYYYGRTSR